MPRHPELDGLTVVDDEAGLMWQQSGSTEELRYEDAKAYVEGLNNEKFAGHEGWRLPTVSELESLAKPAKEIGGVNLDPLFDKTQISVWTSEMWVSPTAPEEKALNAYYVNFWHGATHVGVINPDYRYSDKHYVRAVRGR